MRRIMQENIQAGMILAQPIVGLTGQVIINAGVVLNEANITRLQSMDIGFIYIQDDGSALINDNDIEAQNTRKAIVNKASSVVDGIKVGKFVQVEDKKRTVLNYIDELACYSDIQPMFTAMQSCNDYLFAHSVNGCFLALGMGEKAGLVAGRMKELAVGALMRDVGMLKIDADIINKPGSLTEKETEIIRQHPQLGFEMLRGNPDISLAAANCVLQHHERFDGSGYPRGIDESKIHQFAEIVAITDVYTSMTATTPYRKALSVYDAMFIIQRSAGTYFSTELISMLAENVLSYPRGAIVKLNDKSIGVVAGFKNDNLLEPTIQVRRDAKGNDVNYNIDIKQSPKETVYIADVLKADV